MPKTVEELEKELASLTETHKKEKDALSKTVEELTAELETPEPAPPPRPRPARVPGNPSDLTFVSRKEWDAFKSKNSGLFGENVAATGTVEAVKPKSFGKMLEEFVFGGHLASGK